jgi:hypothetical protein
MNDSVDDKKSVQVFVERDRKVFLVWNAEDVKRLRTKHRFVGELVGTLPTHKSQNDYLGLPLQLSVEEVSVGCFYGFLELVTWKESPEDVVASAQEEPKSCTRKRRYSEMEASSDSMESVGASQKLRRVVGTWKDTVANVFQSLLSFWKDWNKNTDHAESLEQLTSSQFPVEEMMLTSPARSQKCQNGIQSKPFLWKSPTERTLI